MCKFSSAMTRRLLLIARRATFAQRQPQADSLSQDRAGARAAAGQPQIAAGAQRRGQQDRVLKADLAGGQQRAVGFIGIAHQVARQRLPAAMVFVSCRCRQCADRGQQRRQRRGVTGGAPGAEEYAGPLRRLAAVTPDRRLAVTKIASIELSDAVVAQASPAADGAGARLEPDETDCEVHARGVAAVAVVGDSHGPFPYWHCFSNLVKISQI